ncbi:hypothetical protein ACFZB2_40970 [Streptomyces bobili]|uniref:Pepco domain-containing protein n=1 Tax=Streptomyces bobili TaxID=67280 RepID=UPI0036E07E17
MTDEDTISVVGVAMEERSFRRRGDVEMVREDVSVGVLRERIDVFVKALAETLSSTQARIGHYQLEQVEVAAEVSAKGKVSILGSGGEVGGSGGLTFTFVRKDDKTAGPLTRPEDGTLPLTPRTDA